MYNRLFHPQMMRHIARFHYPNLVTAQTLQTTYDAANEPVFSWVDDPLLKALQAYIEPIAANQEVRRSDQTIVTNAWNVTIAGSYPRIDEAMRLIDDRARAHNIISVDVDSFNTQTNLITEIVNEDPNNA